MKNMTRTIIASLTVLLPINVVAIAADKPLLAAPGKVLLEDKFDRADLTPTWKVGKGFWSVKDGIVTVAENPADNHGAYAKAKVPCKDFVAEFSFKLDGAKNLHFTIDDLTYKGSHAGHIARASVMPTMIQLADTKFGGMKNEIYEKIKDPSTTPEDKKKIQASIKDKSANFKVTPDPAQWHVLRVEVVGDEMLVSLDGKSAGYLKSQGMAHPTKQLLGFTVGGKSALIKDVKVWEATATPDWAVRRAEVIGAFGK